MKYKDKIQKFTDLINNHNHIVAFTGAGISTDSGIPDLAKIASILDQEDGYSGGIFGMLNRSFATNNPELFYRLYRKTFFHPEAKPNACHIVLSDLEKRHKLLGIATMNIDYLHQKAGSNIVYEYWGDMRKNRCSMCEQVYDWDLAQQEKVPLCKHCGSVILPEFVYRNLGTYPDDIRNGNKIIQEADMIIVAGTKQSGRGSSTDIPKVIINLERPSYLDKNTLFIQGNIGSVFQDLNIVISGKEF